MKRLVLMLLLMAATCIFPQSLYFKLTWEPNPETNIRFYEVLRGTDSTALNLLDTVTASPYFDFNIESRIPYYYGVRAVNAFGLRSELSDIRMGVVERTPIFLEKLSQTSVRIQWSSQQPSAGMVKYGPSYPLQLESAKETSFTSNHEVVLSDLSPEISYFFVCLSWTENGDLVASQDSLFSLAGPLQARPEIFVYPNPVKRSAQNGTANFTGMPAGSKILIFNLMGEPVWESDRLDVPFYQWSLTDPSGRRVSSGVYVYLIKTEGNKELAKGKLLIIN